MPGKVGGRPTGMNKRRIERIKEVMQKRKDKQMQKNKNEMSMMPEGAKKGAAIKIKKVAKGLEKASKTHAAQAKTLKSVKANKGTIVDKFFKDRVASEKRDIRKTEQMVGASISSKREKARKTSADDRAIKKGILRKKASYSKGGFSRGGGAAIKGTDFKGIF
tara:strand:+ start:503 stop:991 length:489 start_codon:yes stop_codon:yes gene_type:complete